MRLGRRYADLARNDKRTMFDEVALMNDLNAIHSTASAKLIGAEKPTENTEERLAKLEQLHSKGLITDEEYKGRRSAILDEI